MLHGKLHLYRLFYVNLFTWFSHAALPVYILSIVYNVIRVFRLILDFRLKKTPTLIHFLTSASLSSLDIHAFWTPCCGRLGGVCCSASLDFQWHCSGEHFVREGIRPGEVGGITCAPDLLRFIVKAWVTPWFFVQVSECFVRLWTTTGFAPFSKRRWNRGIKTYSLNFNLSKKFYVVFIS